MVGLRWGSGEASEVSDQFPIINGRMHQTPLTPSLSPSDGERVAEGRVRGLPANPLIVIGKWYETPTAGPHLAPCRLCGFRWPFSPQPGPPESQATRPGALAILTGHSRLQVRMLPVAPP